MEDRGLSAIWLQMHGERNDLEERCEQYARWTLPHLFTDREDDELKNPTETEQSSVAIGPRLVNHLSHRVIDTMFPNDAPFFNIDLTPEATREFRAKDPKGERWAALQQDLREVENAAVRNMDLTAYRPQAITAIQLNIITGNSLIFRHPDGKRSVYSLKDFCVERSIVGMPLKVVLRDVKRYGSLDEELREAVMAAGKEKAYKDDTPCNLYTFFEYRSDKWYMRQAVDDVEVEAAQTSYNVTDFPCLILAWNLARGENYGRGLVEEYAVMFHNVDVLTSALIDMIGVAADLKILVNPAGSTDVEEFASARRGDYVAGKEGDLHVPEFQFAVNIEVVSAAIQKYERELSQAFLLSSAGVRDAERVTAEEIRFFAREMESAFGGIYSRLALEWQKREADYQLSQLKLGNFLGESAKLETTVTAGLQTLTRDGKLERLRLAVADLQMLDAVPEDLRAAINPAKFAAHIFGNRGVDASTFLYTADEMAANRQAQQRAEQEQALAQGEAQAAAKAATQ